MALHIQEKSNFKAYMALHIPVKRNWKVWIDFCPLEILERIDMRVLGMRLYFGLLN